VPNLGNGIIGVVYDIELSRITATTVSPNILIKRWGAFGWAAPAFIIHSPAQGASSALTIPSLDSGDIDVVFKAISVTSGDITLDRIQLLKITA